MPFKLKNPFKITVIVAIAVILLGLACIGLAFSPYGNPPQCEGLQHPDRGDHCIIGANIGAGLFLFLGLAVAWLGILGLLAAFAYRAKQSHQQTKQRLLLVVVAMVFIAPFILWQSFISTPANDAIEKLEQEESAFQEKYRSDFVVYSTPPDWDVDSGRNNTPIFKAGPSGIEFGDFLTKNCDSI